MKKVTGSISIKTPILLKHNTIPGRNLRGSLGYYALLHNLSIAGLFPDWDTRELIVRDTAPISDVECSTIITPGSSEPKNIIFSGLFNFEILVKERYVKDLLLIMEKPINIGKGYRKGNGQCQFSSCETFEVEPLSGERKLKTPAIISIDDKNSNLVLLKRVGDLAEKIYVRTIPSGTLVNVENEYFFGLYGSLGFGEIC